MSEMGFGYGSEFQLLRYLGHHRNYLDKQIQAATGSNSPIYWLDYPIRDGAKDGELKGVECFKEIPSYKDILSNWKNFWPQRGNLQNWDGVFRQDDIWYFVEAKAQVGEPHKKSNAKENGGRTKILKAFIATCGGNETMAKQWLESNCYQLANRLAFVHFCKENQIKARLCLICFISGYKRNSKIEVQDKNKWDNLWGKEFEILSLTEAQKKDIVRVDINCTEG